MRGNGTLDDLWFHADDYKEESAAATKRLESKLDFSGSSLEKGLDT